VQLQLTFRKAVTGKNSKGFLEEVGVTVLPLLALPVARTPELIGALTDPEESRPVRIPRVKPHRKSNLL
jgi:hypothetical protein